MKLGYTIGKNAKIWEILTKLGKFWLFFTKKWFSQNRAVTDFFIKSEARRLKFVVVIPIYDGTGICGTDFQF